DQDADRLLDLPPRDHPLVTAVGRAALLRHPVLERARQGRPFRRVRTADAVRRRAPQLLPARPLTAARLTPRRRCRAPRPCARRGPSAPATSSVRPGSASHTSTSRWRALHRAPRGRRPTPPTPVRAPCLLRYRFPGGAPTPPSSEAWGPWPTPSVTRNPTGPTFSCRIPCVNARSKRK